MTTGTEHRRIIISGGGTGGHVFPAIAIADALRGQLQDPEILFVGAEGRMEMERVPQAGYRIVGLPVEGFRRKLTPANLKVLLKFLKSLRMAGRLIRKFSPDVVIGVGGYASAPVLRKAAGRGIPTLIQEQNSYAGLTNRLLAKKAGKICVAYEGMERYFPSGKLVLTGNPVRERIRRLAGEIPDPERSGARAAFGFDENDPVLLVLGGSLGARTINDSLQEGLPDVLASGAKLIWQCGKYYFEELRPLAEGKYESKLLLKDFIGNMDQAYLAADVIISRAGALSISELCIAAKPVILVPSPNVAEDHQTRNARALASRQAAVMISDAEARQRLVPEAIGLLKDARRKEILSGNIRKLAVPDAAERIAREAMMLIKG